jgi:hypothetical protein
MKKIECKLRLQWVYSGFLSCLRIAMTSDPVPMPPEEDFCLHCNRTVVVTSTGSQAEFKSECGNPYCPITGKLAASVGGELTGIEVVFKAEASLEGS